MRDTPYFWQLVTVGALASVVELSLMLWSARARREGLGAPSGILGGIPLWSVVASLVVALVVPIFVVVLVNRGRDELVGVALGLRHFRHTTMEDHWSQEGVLALGTVVGLPPLLLASLFAGSAVGSRARSRLERILFSLAAPAILVPFVIGAGLYPYRLLNIEIPQASVFSAREQAPYWAAALASGKRGLEAGAAVAGCVLAVLVVLAAIRVVRKKDDGAHEWPPKRTAVVASTVMLAVGALLCWFAAPLAAENRTPFPGHDLRFTKRVFPAVPAGASQRDLNDLSTKARMGHYWDRLRFPLSARAEAPLLRWGLDVEPRRDGVALDGLHKSPQSLREAMDLKAANLRYLHSDETGSTLIMALPDLPVELIADALAVCYERGEREVRLVTGLPETSQRPLVGRLTRVIYQTTSVSLARDNDLDPSRQKEVIALSAGPRRYRALLDEVFAMRSTSSIVTLLLPPTGGWRYGSPQPE